MKELEVEMMCMTCGCGKGQTLIGGHALARQHKPGEAMRYRAHEPGSAPAHARGHAQSRDTIDFGAGPAGTHAPGISQSRMVKIERDILAKNNDYAGQNRRYFSAHGIFALNLVSSPGSGKTTLLVKTITALNGAQSLAVIEGDQQTDNDAARIRAAGAPAVQINTGKGCHLDAHMVGQAMQRLAPDDDSLLLIENVGNLVCPAAFDLGEAHKAVIFSVTEGEDKPLKYPDMFRAARPDAAQQVRPVAPPGFRCRPRGGKCAPRQSGHTGDPHIRDQRRRHHGMAGLDQGRL